MADGLVGARAARRAGAAAVAEWRRAREDGVPAPPPDWFEAPFLRRVIRRLLVMAPWPPVAACAVGGGRATAFARECAFWSGIRSATSSAEWRRLTASSYVVLYYHRLAGEGMAGQERLDLPAAQFADQMRFLRRLGFRPLSPAQLLRFHSGSPDGLPRRSVLVTADDGFLDCVEPFQHQADIGPALFVVTGEVGGHAGWAGEVPLAAWEDLARLASAGVVIGSHAERHERLPELDETEMTAQLRASRNAIGTRLSQLPDLIAYPHGERDERVLRAAREAGFRLGFTTDPGRNGAGTDPLQLRRVGVKAWDSRLSFLWKALTGELLPQRWERRRLQRRAAAQINRG